MSQSHLSGQTLPASSDPYQRCFVLVAEALQRQNPLGLIPILGPAVEKLLNLIDGAFGVNDSLYECTRTVRQRVYAPHPLLWEKASGLVLPQIRRKAKLPLTKT